MQSELTRDELRKQLIVSQERTIIKQEALIASQERIIALCRKVEAANAVIAGAQAREIRALKKLLRKGKAS